MFETERLLLRRWRVSDAALQRELWTERDARVPAYRRLDSAGRPTVAELEERIRADAQPGLLAAESRLTGQVIGYCGLIENTHGQPREPELAFEFLRSVWGQGYATEASEAAIAWAQSLGHERLWATVREWNVASRRVLAKVGFVETGRVERDPNHGDSLFMMREL